MTPGTTTGSDRTEAFPRFCAQVHQDVGLDFGPHPVGIVYGVAVTSCTRDDLHRLRTEIAAQHADWTILRADHARADLMLMLYAIEQAITEAPSANAPDRRRRAGSGLASRIRAVVRNAACPSA